MVASTSGGGTASSGSGRLQAALECILDFRISLVKTLQLLSCVDYLIGRFEFEFKS